MNDVQGSSPVIVDASQEKDRWLARCRHGGARVGAVARDLGACFALATCLISFGPAFAETMSGALSKSYGGNPDLNQQRAASRASDEGVAQAKAGYRPMISGSGSMGFDTQSPVSTGSRSAYFTSNPTLTVTQNIFNGNKTLNGVRQAETAVLQSREQIRNTEQNTLQSAATAYMNVLRDTAILELNRNNIIVLSEQLRETRDRLKIGDVTRTDVAQAESSLATGRSNYYSSQANLQTSIGNYRQIVGTDPRRLEAARPIDAILPKTLDEAVAVASVEHPNIVAALHAIDTATLQVQLATAPLYPVLDANGTIQDSRQFPGSTITTQSGATANATVPIYTGGDTYAAVRQAKETLSQVRLQADVQRDMIRAEVVSSWGQLEAAKRLVYSTAVAVKAAEIALNGVRNEAKEGERTTLDVLMAQQTLLQSRVSLVSAQRDRVVTTYALAGAIGRLSAATLALDVKLYDPTIHYTQVKDKWIGLRTPTGVDPTWVQSRRVQSRRP